MQKLNWKKSTGSYIMFVKAIYGGNKKKNRLVYSISCFEIG